MSFRRWLLGGNSEEETGGDPKLWKVGDHQVKKITKTKSIRLHGTTHEPTRKVKEYKCVDCEKESGHRANFKRKECYEVIDNARQE